MRHCAESQLQQISVPVLFGHAADENSEVRINRILSCLEAWGLRAPSRFFSAFLRPPACTYFKNQLWSAVLFLSTS